MWIFLPTGGFLSIVKKPEDEARGTVTVRARVRADLIELREHFLPALGSIDSAAGTDYPHRAVVLAADFEQAMAAMARAVTYSNFKSEVSRVKGSGRARVYHLVWSLLLKLQRS